MMHFRTPGTLMIGARMIGALLVGFLLAGCASSNSPPSTYLLPSADSAGNSASTTNAAASMSGNAPLLVIRAVHLAPFLEVQGIIFQLDDVRLQEAGNHQWAEPLSAVVERGLRDRLADRLPQGRVMLNRDVGADSPELSLQVEVDQFQGLYSGYAVVSGQWQMSDTADKTLVQRRFDIKVPLASDGYPALVRALSSGLDQLSDEISAQANVLQSL